MEKIKIPSREIADKYKNKGIGTTRLGRIYRVNAETIRKRLMEKGVERRQRKIELPVNEVITSYHATKSTYKTGKIFGANHNTIGRLLKKEGVKLYYGRELPIDEVMDLYDKARSVRKIADEYRTGRNRVRELLKNEGIDTRTGEFSLEKLMGEELRIVSGDEYKDMLRAWGAVVVSLGNYPSSGRSLPRAWCSAPDSQKTLKTSI